MRSRSLNIIKKIIRSICYIFMGLFLLAVVIEIGADFLLVLGKVVIIIAGAIIIIALLSKIPRVDIDNEFVLIGLFVLGIIISTLVYFPVEDYLVNEQGWTWLKYTPEIPSGDHVRPLSTSGTGVD